MYTIRVSQTGDAIEAAFSAEVTTSELLRAVSQAFMLAEAGGIHRALCDLTAIETGPLPGISVVAASFAAHCGAGQRIAMLCTEAQLPQARKFARLARVGEELGMFTRREDAEEWLASASARRLSRTAIHHLGGFQAAGGEGAAEMAIRASA